MRAGGLQSQEFVASMVFTVLLLSLFAAALPFGLLSGVTMLCVGSIAMQILFALWARQRIRKHLGSGGQATEAGSTDRGVRHA